MKALPVGMLAVVFGGSLNERVPVQADKLKQHNNAVILCKPNRLCCENNLLFLLFELVLPTPDTGL